MTWAIPPDASAQHSCARYPCPLWLFLRLLGKIEQVDHFEYAETGGMYA